MRMAVGMDAAGRITGTAVVDHKETVSYFKRVMGKDIPASMKGKMPSQAFVPGEDVDAITGATSTLTAMTAAVRRAARKVADEVLHIEVPPEPSPPLTIGLQEIVLILLFVLGFWGLGKRTRYSKALRWIYLLTGAVVLGVWFNIPLTLVNINSFLLGYWPEWQTHLYWYLLITGVLLAVLLFDRSPYCHTFCPMGAAQDCLGAVGQAKQRIVGKPYKAMRWIQRFLAWGVILWALYFQNPGAFSYEISSTLFDLTGEPWQFILLGVVILASLALVRPWCNFLCPVRAVTEYIRCLRTWITRDYQARAISATFVTIHPLPSYLAEIARAW